MLEAAREAEVPAVLLGYSGGPFLTVEGVVTLPVADIKATHEGWLPNYMNATE